MSTITAEERDKMPLEDFGRPSDRGFPVRDQHDLDDAFRALGRTPAGDREEVRRRLVAIARRRGLTLPESGRDRGKADAGEFERKSIPFEVKSVTAEGHGEFEGIGGAFLGVDSVGDIIVPGAFKDDIPDFLKDGFIGGIDHDWKGAIGHPAEARETAEGLYVRGVYDGSPEAQSTRAKMTAHPETKRATVRKLSIGYKVKPGGAEFLDGLEDVRALWDAHGYTPTPRDLDRAASGVRALKKLKLYEVSPVMVPANDLATVHSAKSAAPAGLVEHSRKVASAAGEVAGEMAAFLGRLDARMEARSREGRGLSDAQKSGLREALDRWHAYRDEVADLCRRLAEAIAEEAPGAPGAPGIPTPEEEAALMDRFRRIMYATNPALS